MGRSAEEHSRRRDGASGAKILRQEPVRCAGISKEASVAAAERERAASQKLGSDRRRVCVWGGGTDNSGPVAEPGRRLVLQREIPRVLSRAGHERTIILTGAPQLLCRKLPEGEAKG